MPEGDTIHRAASTLQHALQGQVVTAFETAYAQLSRFDDDVPIAGRTIESVVAQGKHLLMRFSAHPERGGRPLTLRTHMRMSGSWHIYRPGERWQRPRRDMRVVVATAAYVAVAFSVPVAEFLDDGALARDPTLRRLGPDLLAATLDSAEALRRLRARPAQALSEVLLDQSVVAGAGNVYRSELLFLAGLDPFRPVADVSDEKLTELLAIAARVMGANVHARSPDRGGGIVTYAGLRRTAHRRDPGERLWVYGRRGKPCRRCGNPIAYRKTGINVRGLYYCPVCQR
jgi:endonuclease VIII